MRHAPHIPVPSTIIVLSDTSVGISYFFVSKQTNFIMIAGPMAKHLSTFSRLMTASTPSVTNPFCPYEPSSVMIITSSELARISFSRIINSFVRPANTVITRFPAAFSACTIGSIGATPTPPPAHTTVPNFSICVACPSGPTTSVISSPTSSWHNFVDESPTSCTTRVMVPFFGSASAMVSGIRSPFSPTRTITKCPALRERAINGASTSSFTTFAEKNSLLTILFILFYFLSYSNNPSSRTNIKIAA